VPASEIGFLFQTAFANFAPHAAIAVNFRKRPRGAPLLLIAGRQRSCHAELTHQKRTSTSIENRKPKTDYKEYPEQAHFTLLQDTKVAGLRARLGALSRQWVEANRSSKSDRRLVGFNFQPNEKEI